MQPEHLEDHEIPPTVDRGLGVGYGKRDPEEDEGTPRALGDFKILRELGRGAMGVVYLAEQVSLGRQVALKVLPAHLTLQQNMIERFRIEASSAARLHHPGIVRVHHVGEDTGHHFFAMELLEGSSLDDVLGELRAAGLEALNGSRFGTAVARTLKRVDDTVHEEDDAPIDAVWQRSYVETVCRIAAQIAEALQHAHDAGVVHRDVKPSNIIVRGDGSAVLTDFGLARREGLPHLTQTGVFIGTPNYTSPEQARPGSAAIDNRSDVFALGVTLYELLTLQRPFEGSSATQVLDHIVKQEPVNPRKLNRRLPLDLATITLKALEKDPSRRYQTAGALAADLESFLRFESISARPESFGSRAVKFVRRHRTASVITTLLVVAALGAWSWWWSRKAPCRVESEIEQATVFLDGTPFGATNENLLVDPGTHVVRVAKEPELFSLEQRIDFARGERQVLRIELSGPEDFCEMLLEEDPMATRWLQQGLPEGFRAQVVEELKARDRDLVQALARSDLEEAARIGDDIRRLDCLDPERVASQRAESLDARAKEVDRTCRELYEEIRLVLEGEEPGTALERILELRRLRFEGWQFERARDDAQELSAELARRLAKRSEERLAEKDLEEAGKALALLQDVDPGYEQIDSLALRLEKARKEDRIERLLEESDQHKDPRSAEPKRLEEIVTELRGLSAGVDAIQPIEAALIAARFEQWLQQSHIESKVVEAIEAGSIQHLEIETGRLAAGIDLARPQLDAEPIQRFTRLTDVLDSARTVVVEYAELERSQDPAEVRAGIERLRNVPLPTEYDAAREVLLNSLLERTEERERCFSSLDDCAHDVRSLSLASARAGLDDVRSRAGVLEGQDATEILDRVAEVEAELAETERAEAELRELLAPLELFLAPLNPLPSAEADRSLQTLLGRLRSQLRRASAAIDAGPDDARLAELLLRRARLHVLLGSPPEALADARRSLASRATSAGHLAAARALLTSAFEQGDASALADAASELELALDRPDADPRAFYWRAVCRASRGEAQVAVTADLTAALERGLDLPEVHLRFAQGELATLTATPAEERRRRREGVDLAVQHANQGLDALDARAESLLSAEDSLVLVESARRLRRDLLLARGKAYHHGRNFRSAISTFEEAAVVDDAHAETWLRLANALTGVPTDESYYEALDVLKTCEARAHGDKSMLDAAENLRQAIYGWLRGER